MVDDLVILCYVGLSQAVFATLLLFTKRPIGLPDKIMVFWLLTIALRFWLVANGIQHQPFFDIAFSDALIPLTFGPFLYLYSKYLITEQKNMPLKDFVHFIPFVFLSIYFLVLRNSTFEIATVDYGITLNLLFLISVMVYSSLVFIQLRKYRKSVRFNLFSYDTSSNRLFWLNYVAVISVATYAVYFVYMLLELPGLSTQYNLQFISSLGLVVFSFSVSYFGVNQVAIANSQSNITHYGMRNMASDFIDKYFSISKIGRFKNISEVYREALEQNSKEGDSEKDETITLIKKGQIDFLKKHMEEERPFLNSMLTLQDLADQTNIPKHQLTILFNNYMGLNFFEFVNQYRLEVVKQKLLNPKYEHYTIMAIAYECGFNSKSTFNTLFKESTGQTPSKWKKAAKSAEEENLQNLPNQKSI